MDVLLRNRFTAAKFGWQPRWFNPDLEKWLHRIKLPALVVWGDDDKLLPPAYAALWRERLPDARARHAGCSAATCRMSNMRTLVARQIADFLAGSRGHEARLLPSDAVPPARSRGGGEAPLGLGRAAEHASTTR